ncbi:MAG: hypothetical protein ACYDH6_24095 [Acidimicrobiales bacterium]
MDLDNLPGVRGGARAVDSYCVASALTGYVAAAQVRWGDHAIVIATNALGGTAKQAWPGARVCVRRAPLADGHVLAALATGVVAARYERVVVGSGGAALAALTVSLERLGAVVGVHGERQGGWRPTRRLDLLVRRDAFVRMVAP